jgi:hypothetical protein
MVKKKRGVVVWGLVALGVAMIVIGGVGGLVPPALTGVGFLLIAWMEGGR